MKTKALTLFFLLSANFLPAQNTIPPQPERHVRFKVLHGDSVVVHFNKKYELIEDSCADIVRTARYNPKTRQFAGAFKDINANNSAQLISEGNYTEDGLKNGMFTCYFFNGVQQSRGQFIANKPVGHWDIFYETGKPKLSFDSEGGVIKITNGWDETGKKTVDNLKLAILAGKANLKTVYLMVPGTLLRQMTLRKLRYLKSISKKGNFKKAVLWVQNIQMPQGYNLSQMRCFHT